MICYFITNKYSSMFTSSPLSEEQTKVEIIPVASTSTKNVEKHVCGCIFFLLFLISQVIHNSCLLPFFFNGDLAKRQCVYHTTAHAEVIQLRCQSTRRNLPGLSSSLLFFRNEFFQPCDWLKWPSC